MRTNSIAGVRCRHKPFVFAAALALGLCAMGAAGQVAFEMTNTHLDIRVAGEHAARYVWGAPDIPRPFFSEMKAPNGVQVTRTHPPDPEADKGNDDHAAFHPGAWLAFGDLDGADFWRNKARVRHACFVVEPEGGESAGRFAVRNVYETLTGPPRIIAEERAEYTFVVTGHGYLLSCDSVFSPVSDALAFGDQEEMGFGIRLATPVTVRHGGGNLLNSEGGLNEAGTWGRKADWCAGWAEIEGMHVGAVLMPAPDNWRASWFHSRDYGLIVANPFGTKAMTAPEDAGVPPDRTVVGAGETFRLGFAVGLFSVAQEPAGTITALRAAYLRGRPGTPGE